MILDFSQQNLDNLSLSNYNEDWEKEIISFILEFINQKQIKVKTSGSTGKPKEMYLSKENMKLSARLTGKFLGLEKGNIAILALPIAYIAGKMMVVRAIELKLKLICLPPKSKIDWNGEFAHFIALTPLQAEKSLSLIRKCKTTILGGARVNEALEKKLKSIPNEIYETYGMTETITHIAMRKLGLERDFHVLPKMEISQNNEDCLVIKTPYFKHKIITNDIVELTSSQSFRLLGRKDFIINSGGLKINPQELEQQIQPYIPVPFIIHSIPDEKLGQKVVLVVENNEPITIEIPSHLIEKNKFPKEIITIAKFPRTLSGKIKRNEVLKSY